MKASVVIPTYNCIWLPQAVSSIEEQTYKDWEIVIIDDGCTDSTHDYLKWLKDRLKGKLRLFHQKNAGRSVARNYGNVCATGDVIFVLDADDLAMPNRIEKTLEKFKDGVEFVYGSAVSMDPFGNRIKDLQADVFDKDKALETLQNGIVHSSVAYTPDFASRFPYNTGEISDLGLDDWAQQISARVAGVKMDFVSGPICAYRVTSAGISNRRDPRKVEKAKKKFIDSLKVAA